MRGVSRSQVPGSWSHFYTMACETFIQWVMNKTKDLLFQIILEILYWEYCFGNIVLMKENATSILNIRVWTTVFHRINSFKRLKIFDVLYLWKFRSECDFFCAYYKKKAAACWLQVFFGSAALKILEIFQGNILGVFYT